MDDVKNYQVRECPEHLDSLKKMLNDDMYPDKVDAEGVANALYDLMLVPSSPEAQVRVAQFIRLQQSQLHELASRHNLFRERLANWVGWAKKQTKGNVSIIYLGPEENGAKFHCCRCGKDFIFFGQQHIVCPCEVQNG